MSELSLGRVRLVLDATRFRAAFQRFEGCDLNGFSEDKLQRAGQEATVTRVYGDFTVTCAFDDGVQLDFPNEAIAKQLEVREPPLWKLGEVQLLADEKAFRKAFVRFEGDELNGFSQLKLARLGQRATVTKTFGDFTVTCTFGDGTEFDIPNEAIEKQLEVCEPPSWKLGKVQLVGKEQAFRQAFHRFEQDGLNGFSEAKLQRAGQEATVTRVYDDFTVTCAFDDGVQLDFPNEAIAKQLEVCEPPLWKLGEVQLLADEKAFRKAFSRFEGDELNGFSQLKLARLGQRATVTKTFGDFTVTCTFGDGTEFDIPNEAIEEQLATPV